MDGGRGGESGGILRETTLWAEMRCCTQGKKIKPTLGKQNNFSSWDTERILSFPSQLKSQQRALNNQWTQLLGPPSSRIVVLYSTYHALLVLPQSLGFGFFWGGAFPPECQVTEESEQCSLSFSRYSTRVYGKREGGKEAKRKGGRERRQQGGD